MSGSQDTTVWVTRAQPGAERTAEALKASGFVPVIAPVLRVEPLSPALPVAMDGIVFTSRNGVAAFTALTPQRDLTALCVGDATAELAQAAGFADVLSAGSDAIGLRELINAHWPVSRPLLYAAPEEPSAPVADWLRDDGYTADSIAVYRTVPETPALTAQDLSAIRIILIHSARAARQVAKMICGPLLALHARPVLFISISSAVDAALKQGMAQNTAYNWPPQWQSAISPFPDEASMLRLLKDMRS